MVKGWHGNRYGHGLASRGISIQIKSCGRKSKLPEIKEAYPEYVILTKNEAVIINMGVRGWNYVVYHKPTKKLYGFPTQDTMLEALSMKENSVWGHTFEDSNYSQARPVQMERFTQDFYHGLAGMEESIKHWENGHDRSYKSNYDFHVKKYNDRIDEFTKVIRKLYPDFEPPEKYVYNWSD